MGPKRKVSKSTSPKLSVEEQQKRAREYAAENFGADTSISPPVGRKRKATESESTKTKVARVRSTSIDSKGKKKAVENDNSLPKRRTRSRKSDPSPPRSKSPQTTRTSRTQKKNADTGTPVMSEDDDDDKDKDEDDDDEMVVEKAPKARGRSRSTTKKSDRAISTDKVPSPVVLASQKRAQEYAEQNFGTAKNSKVSPKQEGRSQSRGRSISPKPPKAEPYAGLTSTSLSTKTALPSPSLRQRSDRRSGGGPFSNSAVKVPPVPTDAPVDFDQTSIPSQGRTLARSPDATASRAGRSLSKSATPPTSSPRVSYNPDDDPWFVQHIDGVAVVVIGAILIYSMLYSGGGDRTMPTYTVEELKAMTELKQSQTMYMLVIVIFFPLVYLASSGGWFNFAMAQVFGDGSPTEGDVKPIGQSAPVVNAAASVRRTGRSISPMRPATATDTSKYDYNGRPVGANRRNISATSTSTTTPRSNAPPSGIGASLVGTFADPIILGIACATIAGTITVVLYPSKYSLYAGLLTFALVTAVILLKLHEYRNKQQVIIDGLTRLAKDTLRNGHRGGPFPVSYILEELLELSEDKKLPNTCPSAVKKLSLAKIKAIWPEVCRNVLTDTRVQQATMDFQGAQKMQCWKFAGAADMHSPPPASFGFLGGGYARNSRTASPFIARANTGTK